MEESYAYLQGIREESTASDRAQEGEGMNDNEVCRNCGHLGMQHGFPTNAVCGNISCSCEEFEPSDIFQDF